MEGGHELLFRFERDGISAGMAIQGHLSIDAGLLGRHQQRRFGGVAHQEALAAAGAGSAAA